MADIKIELYPPGVNNSRLLPKTIAEQVEALDNGQLANLQTILNQRLTRLNTVDTRSQQTVNDMGTRTLLETTDKSTLVAAINEVLAKTGGQFGAGGTVVNYEGTYKPTSDINEINIVNIIPQYTSADMLFVFTNTTFFKLGRDFSKTLTGIRTIGSTVFKANTTYDFILFKTIPMPTTTFSGVLINDGTVTEEKLAPNIKIGLLTGLTTSTKLSVVDAINELVTNLTTHAQGLMVHGADLSSYASDKDAEGIYKVVDFKRRDSTLCMKSTLSNPTSEGKYQNCTWQFYCPAGLNVTQTIVWTLTWDADGKIQNKVVTSG